jgi:uncharacterized protein
MVFINTITLLEDKLPCDSRRQQLLFFSADQPAMSTKSPCIDICKFDSKTGFCIGCMRTREECKEWKKMKNKHRRKIVDDQSKRAAMIKK